MELRPTKKAKKMVLRQVIAQQALQQGPMVESDEEGDQQEPVTSRTYDQEQARLKHSFLEVRAGALLAPVIRLESSLAAHALPLKGCWGAAALLHGTQQLLFGVRRQESMPTK